MELSDCISTYAALLSTGLALRELWKLRRSPRPHLRIVLDEALPRRRGSARRSTEGLVTKLRLHNLGGEDITVHAHALAVPKVWIPTPLLQRMGETGSLPCCGKLDGRPRKWARSKVVVPAGADVELSVVLWHADRQALDRGRLMVNLALTGDSVRSRQFLVQMPLLDEQPEAPAVALGGVAGPRLSIPVRP